MTKQRVLIPARIREAVLKEFNHRCAMCGASAPQVHHIDENPSNNDSHNLLPLCPNHHLRDHHDPTADVDRGKLALFRKYKDPLILRSQFQPLWQRFSFLYSIDENTWANSMENQVNELVAFVRALKMGRFYAKRLQTLLVDPARAMLIAFGEKRGVVPGNLEQMRAEHIAKLRINRDAAEGLVVELLRYQDWSSGVGSVRGRNSEHDAS